MRNHDTIQIINPQVLNVERIFFSRILSYWNQHIVKIGKDIKFETEFEITVLYTTNLIPERSYLNNNLLPNYPFKF